jgi:hypothetical protein
MQIEYKAAVFTQAGWRSVNITAEVDQVSPGMAVVKTVTAIDGEEPKSNMSRTGAKRQAFHGTGIAAREVGARKRLSTCQLIAA